MSESYTTGGDSHVSLPKTHWAGQTFRVQQEHELQFIDLMLKLWGLSPEPFVGVFYADADHEPFGDCLSRNRYWLINQAFLPRDWPFYEPWGKTKDENYEWIALPLGTTATLTIKNSIATITNPGNPDCGFFTHRGFTLPLINPDDNTPLRVAFDNPEATADSTSSQNLIEILLENNSEKLTIYLAIAVGGEWEHRKPQEIGTFNTTDYGWFWCGEGYHDLDLYQLFVTTRTALGKSTDPTGWHINQIGFALGTQSPSTTDWIKSDYLGFYHSTTPQTSLNLGSTGYSWPGKTYRVRFSMQPLILSPNLYYVILATSSPALLQTAPSWQYDELDATYPRGIRIFSDDSKETWTKHYNDDHMFAEFGDPPLPKPEPPPPIPNFAPIALLYLYHLSSITFRLATSVPCHLTCYYTDKKPLKHPLSTTIRGITVPWSTYFCFVAWLAVEQTEPGDTLYHTFEMPNWTECQTKWFTFRGNIDTELSPSISPIFKHHHTGYIEPTPFKDTYMLSYYPDRNYGPQSHFTIRDGWGDFTRTILSFDLSSIPKGTTIAKATLSIYFYSNPLWPHTGKLVRLYKCTRPEWIETEATWNSYQTTKPWTTPGGDYETTNPPGASFNMPAAHGWIDIDIKNLIQDAVTKGINAHILMKFDNETAGYMDYSICLFRAREYTDDPTLRPKLTIFTS